MKKEYEIKSEPVTVAGTVIQKENIYYYHDGNYDEPYLKEAYSKNGVVFGSIREGYSPKPQ